MKKRAVNVPDLIRDLISLDRSSFVKLEGASQRDGAFCLHHGLSSWGGDLYRSHAGLARARRGPSRRSFSAYCKVQNQDPCLVRAARKIRSKLKAGTAVEALAEGLEKRADIPDQPALAGFDLSHRLLTVRSRIKSGTRRVLLVSCGVALAACALPEAEPLDLPGDIEAALPADIDRSEVNVDPKGCYFYVYAGDLFQVKDANGNSICLSEGETS